MAQLTCNFFSYTLRRAVDVSVIIPTPVFGEVMDEKKRAAHTPEEPYPVLYLLHGYGNDFSTWLRYTSAERYAEENSIAVVTFSGENKFYNNHPGQDLFYDFIQNELPDFVCGLFPISKKHEDTFIAGLSMGGYGALYHALYNPGKYRAFGAFSAGISQTGFVGEADYVSDGEQRVDLTLLVTRLKDEIKSFPPCYLSCGTEDFLYRDNIQFKEAYLSAGGDLTWTAVPGYGHEWPFWDQELKAFLEWLPRSDYYREKKRRV